MLQTNQAVELLENKVAAKEDIDVAVKMGLNHPVRPLNLADLIILYLRSDSRNALQRAWQ